MLSSTHSFHVQVSIQLADLGCLYLTSHLSSRELGIILQIDNA